jgi:hypothetical protein
MIMQRCLKVPVRSTSLHGITGYVIAGVVLLLLSGGAWTAPHQRTPAKLFIWPKVAGTSTGAKMQVAVDGNSSGVISNLTQQQMIDIGDLTVGLHQFALTGIEVHAIDQAGNAQLVNNGKGTCSGQFVVQAYQTYYFVMVGTTNGTDFQCRIQ